MNCRDIAALCPQYLSGELDTPRSADFAKHLRNCPGCAAEIEQQTRMDAMLRSVVQAEGIDNTWLDRRVRRRIASERPFFSLRRIALVAGVAAILFAAFIGYRRVFVPAAPLLCEDAARDHRSEVTGRQHRNWLTDSKAVADLAERNGVPGSLAGALTPAGYRLERGKLCRLDGRVFLHLVYAQGPSEFSAYLRPLDGQQLSGPIHEDAAGKLLHEANAGREHIAYFQTGQLTAIFVTDQSAEVALSIARSAARVL